MEENWKRLFVFPSYEISDFGRIRRIKTGRILKTNTTCHRYQRGTLSVTPSGKCTPFKVHNLVAEAFIGPRPDGAEINHIDGNRLNNRADNLEYCSPQQNRAHASTLGIGQNKLTDFDVRVIRRTQLKIQEIADIFGLSVSAIGRAKRGRTWKRVIAA